jgi:DNA-directed RNA polymerase specialized sigma24 family protein
MEVILRVIEKISPKYTFGYYEADDIRQESYIICLKALKKYDESRPLENFLSRHLSNRLKSLIRDKYSRSNTATEKHTALNESKRNLVDLRPIEYEPIRNLENEMMAVDLIRHVRHRLTPSMRNDLDRVLAGVSISSTRRSSLFTRIKELLPDEQENW